MTALQTCVDVVIPARTDHKALLVSVSKFSNQYVFQHKLGACDWFC